MSELVIVNEDDEIVTKKAKKCITKLYNSRYCAHVDYNSYYDNLPD